MVVEIDCCPGEQLNKLSMKFGWWGQHVHGRMLVTARATHTVLFACPARVHAEFEELISSCDIMLEHREVESFDLDDVVLRTAQQKARGADDKIGVIA